MRERIQHITNKYIIKIMETRYFLVVFYYNFRTIFSQKSNKKILTKKIFKQVISKKKQSKVMNFR